MYDIFYTILKHNNINVSSFPKEHQALQVVKFDDLKKIDRYLSYDFDKITQNEDDAEKMYNEVNDMLHKTPIYVPFFYGYKKTPLFELYGDNFTQFFTEEDANAYIYKYGEEPVEFLQSLFEHSIYRLAIQELSMTDFIKNPEHRNYAIKFIDFLDKNKIVFNFADIKTVDSFDTIYCHYRTHICGGNFNNIKVIISEPDDVYILRGDFSYIEIEPTKDKREYIDDEEEFDEFEDEEEYIDYSREDILCHIKAANIDTLVINSSTVFSNNSGNLHIKNLIVNDRVHFYVIEHLNDKDVEPFIDNYIYYGQKVSEYEFFDKILENTAFARELFDMYINEMMESYLLSCNVSKIKKYIAEKGDYSDFETKFKYIYKIAFDARTIFEETLKYHNCPKIGNKYLINKCPFDLDAIVNELNKHLYEPNTIFIPFVKSKGKYVPFSTKIDEGFMYFWDLDMGDYIYENL
jgi:hypothetical protein